MDASGLSRQRSPDDNLSVRFSIEALENPAKSKEAGRPIFDETEIIEIRIPGDADVRKRAVNEGDRTRFARQYDAWKRNQNQETVSGTPLAAWPMMKRSQVEEAKFFGVHTVEQLANIADVNLQRLGPGWPSLRQQAVDWLKKAEDGALLGKLRAELEERDRRIDALEDMLKRQAAELHRNPTNLTVLPSGDLETLKMKVAELLARTAEPILAPAQSVVTTTTAPVEVTSTPTKQRRRRRTKAEMAAAREAEKNGKG
jgi:hypothetical protein